MGIFNRGWHMPDPEENPLPEEEEAVLEKLARKTVERRMTVPAIMFLESVKPLNYIGSQALVFFEPIVQTVFNFKDYDTFRLALEKRQTLEILIQKIEAYDAVAYDREKRVKKFMKQEKKKWKWYQRWLGLFPPRVDIPEDVLNPPEEKDTPEKEKDNR
jgi:hypothetical protein